MKNFKSEGNVLYPDYDSRHEIVYMLELVKSSTYTGEFYYM